MLGAVYGIYSGSKIKIYEGWTFSIREFEKIAKLGISKIDVDYVAKYSRVFEKLRIKTHICQKFQNEFLMDSDREFYMLYNIGKKKFFLTPPIAP